MNGIRSTALETAEFVAQMIRDHHHVRASARLMQGAVRTCGRQWNQCVRCKGSKIFFCKDDDIVIAALRTQASHTDANDIDGVKSQMLKLERGEPCGLYDGQSSIGDEGGNEGTGVGAFRRVVVEVYDPFRYDRTVAKC